MGLIRWRKGKVLGVNPAWLAAIGYTLYNNGL